MSLETCQLWINAKEKMPCKDGRFKYKCGCFMTIDRHGRGCGKSCEKCKENQIKDAEQYSSIQTTDINFHILSSKVTYES